MIFLLLDPTEEQDHFENGPEMGFPTVCLYLTHLLTFLSFEMCFICMFLKLVCIQCVPEKTKPGSIDVLS